MGGVSLTEIAPRLLDKKASAAYCGYGSRKFGNLVANGVMPPPILAWASVAQGSVVYTDLGISEGMRYGIEAAEKAGLEIEYRTINPTPEKG
jgi:hypothetical protein